MIAMEHLKSLVNEWPAANYIAVATSIIVYLGEMSVDDFRCTPTLAGDSPVFRQFSQDELVLMSRNDGSLCEFP
jgi:hypothetical protein